MKASEQETQRTEQQWCPKTLCTEMAYLVPDTFVFFTPLYFPVSRIWSRPFICSTRELWLSIECIRSTLRRQTGGDQTLANRFLESGIPDELTVDGASVVKKATG
jgi:hypothetical protein